MGAGKFKCFRNVLLVCDAHAVCIVALCQLDEIRTVLRTFLIRIHTVVLTASAVGQAGAGVSAVK